MALKQYPKFNRLLKFFEIVLYLLLLRPVLNFFFFSLWKKIIGKILL